MLPSRCAVLQKTGIPLAVESRCMHARGRYQSLALALVVGLVSPICGVLFKAHQQYIAEAAHSLSQRMCQHALMHVLVLFTAASGFGGRAQMI
jgi:hypothetical protein